MVDEHALIRERERAHLAQQVIDNPVWQEAWAGFAENLQAHMVAPGTTDEAVLEARRGYLVLQRIRKQFEKAMETGKMAELQLERIHGRNASNAEH